VNLACISSLDFRVVVPQRPLTAKIRSSCRLGRRNEIKACTEGPVSSLPGIWIITPLVLIPVAVIPPLDERILPAAGCLFPVCGICHHALPAALLIVSFVSRVWHTSTCSSCGPLHQASLFVIQLISKHGLPLPGLRVPFLLS